jgi:hypothetical protein
MSGDGVSLPTSLAQMGNVAKTQARGQQSAPQVTPYSEQKGSQEELRVRRVAESTEAEKNRVKRQDEEKDKRKRRRLRRAGKKALNRDGKGRGHGEEQDSPDSGESQPAHDNALGSLIDKRV